jgi:4-amino-4-deoxy-L-arabinose transferase-like glycosyltransferase
MRPLEAPETAGDSRSRAVTAVFWGLALVLGGLRMWSTRYTMDPDSISYLDMGDAYLRHDWRMALNGDWNPLYAWVLSLGRLVFRPHPHWEFPYLHLVNFAIYVAGLGCAHFFLLQLHRRSQRLEDSPRWRGTLSVPAWALLALGYSLYIWSSLDLIDFAEGADLLLAAFLYLAFGLLLRLEAGPAGWRPYVLLGVVLGLGYLTKAVMFPLAFVFLATVWLFAANRREALPRMLAALLVFCLVSGPFIAALSRSRGRFTFGDSGKFTYALFVTMDFRNNWSPPYFHWQGGFPDAGAPKHPTRKIFSSPDIYEFDSPFQATYGAWYDPTYWYEGVVARVNVRNQIHVLLWNAREYFRLFVLAQPVLPAGLFILIWIGWRPGFRPKDTAISTVLVLPAVAAFGLYSLVHYLEWRYVAPFVVVTWLALITGVRIPDSRGSERLLSGVIAGVVFTAFLSTILWESQEDLARLRSRSKGSNATDVRTAIKLGELGIRPGDKIAFIGNTFRAHWARLARVRIIAEITRKDAPTYWAADEAVRAGAMEAFAAAGARAVVTDSLPPGVSAAGWEKISGFGSEDRGSNYLYWLSK